MLSSRSSCVTTGALLLGLLWYSATAITQRRESHAPPTLTRPDGVDQKDTLKDFHQALAVQATSQQIAEFQRLLKGMESAKAESEKLLRNDQSGYSTSALDDALDTVRTDTKNFTDGFSETQKSGLREQMRQLDRGETLLLDQQKMLDQAFRADPKPTADVSTLASNLDKALEGLSSQQLTLARTMGIVVASAQDVTFNFPAVKRTVRVANQPLQITVSSILFETAADPGKRTFRLEMMGDLTDFEQNITEVLGGSVNNENTCGERLTVRRAVLMPSAPAGDLHLQLHYERWACLRIAGQSSTTEIAEDNGDVEIELTPAASADGLQLKADFVRIDASGMMGDSLRTGDLGSSLRDKVAQAFLVAMRSAGDLKAVLPAALQGSATIRTARFEDAGAGDLALMLQGDAQLSEEQAKSLASQLNQTLSAEGTQIK